LPIGVLHRLAFLTLAIVGERAAKAHAVFHMIVIAFFFLLRPREYASPSAGNSTFQHALMAMIFEH
jgi:hypothetical protein